jgi:hypothetical protein
MTNDSAGDANIQRKYGIFAQLRGQPANTTKKHHAQMAQTTPLKISAEDGATARLKKSANLTVELYLSSHYSALCEKCHDAQCCLTKKAEPPPTGDVNRDSGTGSANGGWLRRLVRRLAHFESARKHRIRAFWQTRTPSATEDDRKASVMKYLLKLSLDSRISSGSPAILKSIRSL